MGKFNDWFATYSMRICFALVGAANVVGLMFFYAMLPGVNTCAVATCITLASILLITYLAGKDATLSTEISPLRLELFVVSSICAVVLLIYALQADDGIMTWLEPFILALWLFTNLQGNNLLAKVEKRIEELELLKTNNPAAYARYLAEQGRELTEKQEILLFTLPDAKEVLTEYTATQPLFAKAESKLFEHPDWSEFLQNYIDTNGLDNCNEIRLFDLPNAAEMLRFYIEMYCFEDSAAEAKLFAMPEADELVKLYVDNGNQLCEANEVKLFELGDFGVLESYIVQHSLDPAAEKLLVTDERVPLDLVSYYADNYIIDKELSALAQKRLDAAVPSTDLPHNGLIV